MNLHEQLIRLGDMIGDGLADEPDGAWIRAEYRRVSKALGIPTTTRRNNREAIDARMKQRLQEQKCPQCGGQFRQTRAGSKRARCIDCQALYKLLR